ncbi:helix-turn-helix domain-containing protein [Clostridium kluyveri]
MLNRLKFLRTKKNISQYKLAEISGLSQSQISKIEKGSPIMLRIIHT